MARIAFRNLFQSKVRLVISVGGVALALALILALDAIFTGTEQRITAYIDHAGADVFVSHRGVRTMHMSSSALPASVVDDVRAVAGVASATPILYVTNMMVVGDDRQLVYVIGVPPDAPAGGPWRVSAGSRMPAPGQAVISRTGAARAGVGLGDPVTILGREFTIGGLSEGTTNLANAIAFIPFDDFARLGGSQSVVSFVLVTVAPGEPVEGLASRIEAAIPGVTVQTRQAFAAQERRIVRDMSTDLITIMNLVGFLIGLAVVALTVYIATFARRAEYGVLKALGARNGHLYRVVLLQALYSVALGFAVGVAVTLALAAVVPRLQPDLMLAVSSASLAKVGAVALLIAGLAALLPVRQVAGLDPAMVFRGGAT
jgi:putative ABC transport system permease protein